VHTVLVITLLFLQERFLVRSDNLDELTKLGVTIVSLTFWSMLLITHIASSENSIGCVTDTAPFLKKKEKHGLYLSTIIKVWFLIFNYKSDNIGHPTVETGQIWHLGGFQGGFVFFKKNIKKYLIGSKQSKLIHFKSEKYNLSIIALSGS